MRKNKKAKRFLFLKGSRSLPRVGGLLLWTKLFSLSPEAEQVGHLWTGARPTAEEQAPGGGAPSESCS